MRTPQKEERYYIQGMRCAACANSLNKLLNEHDGVSADINFAASLATVKHSLSDQSFSKIQKKSHDAGFDLIPAYDANTREILEKKKLYTDRVFLIGSILTTAGFIPGMIKHQWMLPLDIQFFLSLLVQTIFAWPTTKAAWNSLKNLSANMDTLVSLATYTAFIYSSLVWWLGINTPTFFDANVTIITFILLGKLLEGLAKRDARLDLDTLDKILPNEAWLIKIKDGERTTKEVKATSLRSGDLVLIRAGDIFPGDGIIIQGDSEVDEQTFSGESLPVTKQTGDTVFAGTINLLNPVDIKIREAGRSSSLGKLNAQALNAIASHSNIQRIADRASAFFTPLVLLIAALTFFLTWAINHNISNAIIHSVSVMVVACPCALGLATPIVFLVGISKAAKNGILFKNTESIEKASRLSILAFDKTGTLTSGKPHVSDIYLVSSQDKNQFISAIKSLEQYSEHPLARAISNYEQQSDNLSNASVEKIKVIPGKGIQGILLNDKSHLYFGSKIFVEECTKSTLPPELTTWTNTQEKDGKSVSYLAKNHEIIGGISFADTLRETALPTIKYLKEVGISPLILSGDNKQAVQNIANTLGITSYQAPLSPLEKSDAIHKLILRKNQNNKATVGMIGDGINDSVALAKSDISFAMGNASVLVQDQIDVLFLTEDLTLVTSSIKLSKSCMRAVRQNLGLAFGYNILAIPAACLGFLSPELAALLMATSSLTVVANALRLKHYSS